MRRDVLLYFYYGVARLRAIFFRLITGIDFKSVGVNLKLFGSAHMSVGKNFSVGDGCWLHAVTSYREQAFSPRVTIGDDVSLSDSVHISCVLNVDVGSGVLIGSRVYIGDHSHGSLDPQRYQFDKRPAERLLSDESPIRIGDNVWIGDGVVILAGSVIPSGSVVGANSVVNNVFDKPALLVGVPARVVRAINI